MSDWEDACKGAVPDGWSMCEAEPPTYDEEDAIKCMNSCEQNLCGTYGTNWACPPGWKDRMDVLRSLYDRALLMEKEFHVDVKDAKAMKQSADELHDAVRKTVSAMRSHGFDCIGFADGECGYCEHCAYPEPCIHPEQLVPSISATGTNMSRYFERIGKRFEFGNGFFTLYGIILYRLTEKIRNP